MSCLQKQLHVSRTCTHSPKKQWSCRPTAVTNKKARCYGSQRRCSRSGAQMSVLNVLAVMSTSAVAAAPGNCTNRFFSACRLGAAESDVDLSADELEERMEAFMRKQAEQESGELSVPLESTGVNLSRPLLCATLAPPYWHAWIPHPEQGLCAQHEQLPSAGGIVAAEPQPSKVLGADEVTEEVRQKLPALPCHQLICGCHG